MNDVLARELIDVLKHMAASQRLIEMHLASIRVDARIGRVQMPSENEVSEEYLDGVHARIFSDRERVKHYHDTK